MVEGFTEFLPISSTGHLLVASDLLKFQGSGNGTFEIFIQFGAVIALLAYYAADLIGQAGEVVRGTGSTRRFWLAIFVAFLPAAVIGLAVRTPVKTGLRWEGKVAIRSGVDAGAVVAAAGQVKLQDGSQVVVSDNPPPQPPAKPTPN